MPSIFDEWTLEDAKIAAELEKDRLTDLTAYRAFVRGDHWQNWDGWIGPQPIGGDADDERIRSEIVRGFVSRNTLGECVGRHVNGVLGRNVKWAVVPDRELEPGEEPTAEEQTRIAEAITLLKEWVKVRKLNQEYDKLCASLLVAGMAYQRPFVAPGEVDENGIVPQADLETSLGRVYFNFPLPGEAVVWTDPRTQAKCSIYLYKEVTSSRPSVAKGQEGEEYAELTYLDGDKTIIRIVGGEKETQDFSYALGKRILMADLERRPLLNPQVVSQQKLLNLALTMMERNVIMGGFLERIALNGQFNGHYEDVDDGKGGTRRKFVYDEVPVGAGEMGSITGFITRDAEGRESITTPNVLFRDPVSVQTFKDTIQSAYEAILAECNQLHYSMSGDATASGESRKVAMASYLIDLLQSKQQLDAGWAWLLETALTLAAVLAGQPDYFAGLRVSAECSVDPGPISTEMIKVVIELWREGKITLKTGLGWIGVEDVDGEIAALQVEETQREEMFGQPQRDDLQFGDDLDEAIRGAEGDVGEEALSAGSVAGLNGIQIRTAVDLLKDVASGQIAPSVAVQLLMSLGIGEASAQRMVDEATQFSTREVEMAV